MYTILIVDNDEAVRKMLQRQLLRLKYRVLLAEGGTQALDLLKLENGKVDAVLLDQMMPKMDGLMTFEAIKNENSHYPSTLMITAHGTTHLAVEFMKKGGNDFIQKPIDIEILDIKIRQSIRHEEQRLKAHKQQIHETELKTLRLLTGTVAYEIGNGLNAITGAVSRLESIHGTEKAVEWIRTGVNRILTFSEELSKLIEVKAIDYPDDEKILDVSKSENGGAGKDSQNKYEKTKNWL